MAGPNGTPGPLMVEPIGTRVMCSTPPATTSWYPPAMIPWGELHRLLRRPALPVDRGRRHLLGQPRGQPGVAGHVHRLLPDLGHAAHDHVVDQPRVDPGPLDQGPQH